MEVSQEKERMKDCRTGRGKGKTISEKRVKRNGGLSVMALASDLWWHILASDIEMICGGTYLHLI